MADPTRPNVPFALGVPPILRDSDIPVIPEVRLTKDSASLSTEQAVIWGVFSQQGTLALQPDNIAAFELQREYRISDYPLEEGSFESFNKVTLPYDIRIVMTKGGSLSERKDFLEAVETAVASLDLFTIVTPERVFINANLVRQGYRREATSGASLLTVELAATEIRTKVSVQFVSSPVVGFATTVDGRQVPIFGEVHSASGANPRNNGSVQTVTPPSGTPSLVGGLVAGGTAALQ